MQRTHLIQEPPILVYPSLAVLLGINKAIILQQLHFLLENKRLTRDDRTYVNNRWWVYNTYLQWRDDHFPWLSEDTVKTSLLDLERRGIVITMQSVKSANDRTKWYSIDYDHWFSLIGGKTSDLPSEENPLMVGGKTSDVIGTDTTSESSKEVSRNFPGENLLEPSLDSEDGNSASIASAEGKKGVGTADRDELARLRFERARDARLQNNVLPSQTRNGERETVSITSPDLPSICQAIYRVWDKNDKLKVTEKQQKEILEPITTRDGMGYPSLQSLYEASDKTFEVWMTTLRDRMKKNNVPPTMGTILKWMRGIDWRGGWLVYSGATTKAIADDKGNDIEEIVDLGDLL